MHNKAEQTRSQQPKLEAVQEMREVPRQMDQLEQAIQYLAMRVEDLGDKLHTVLTTPCPSSSKGEELSLETDLGRRILISDSNVRRISEQINDLIDRLAL